LFHTVLVARVDFRCRYHNARERRFSLLDKTMDIFVTDERTRLLLALLMLFILKELPHGILGILSVILGEEFLNSCYQRLSDLMNVVGLFTSALRFPVYYITSSQFRAAFTLLIQCVLRWIRIPQQLQQPNIITDGETHNTTPLIIFEGETGLKNTTVTRL
jgi:hypothetical protein